MSQKATIYTIRTPHDRAEIGKRLELVPIPRDGLDVFVRPHKVLRTGPQNSRLWALHSLRAAHLNHSWPERAAAIISAMQQAGVPLSQLERHTLLHKTWTAEDMHEEFKKRYCGGRSSTKVSKLEMMDKQTEYEADMAGEGVQLLEEAA